MTMALPMSPALSAALSGGSGPAVPPAAAARGVTTKTSVVALSRHPTLPRVAYVSEVAESSPPSSGGRIPRILRQTLVVRRLGPGSGDDSKGDEDRDVLASLPLERLPGMLEGFRRTRQAGGRAVGDDRPVTLATLGPVRSITFLDRDALHWSTRRRRDGGADAPGPTGPLGRGSVVRKPPPDGEGGGVMGRGVAVGLQFARSIAVLRLGGPSSGSDDVLCHLEGQRRSSRNGRAGHRPTSPPLPITDSVLVYGCSDGAMRFHNLTPATVKTDGVTVTRQSTIKSVRGPNGRNDHVCRVVCLDPTHVGDDDGMRGKGEDDGEDEGGSGRASLTTRLLTVCASGVAYVWDVRYAVDGASGTLADLNVLPVSRPELFEIGEQYVL